MATVNENRLHDRAVSYVRSARAKLDGIDLLREYNATGELSDTVRGLLLEIAARTSQTEVHKALRTSKPDVLFDDREQKAQKRDKARSAIETLLKNPQAVAAIEALKTPLDVSKAARADDGRVPSRIMQEIKRIAGADGEGRFEDPSRLAEDIEAIRTTLVRADAISTLAFMADNFHKMREVMILSGMTKTHGIAFSHEEEEVTKDFRATALTSLYAKAGWGELFDDSEDPEVVQNFWHGFHDLVTPINRHAEPAQSDFTVAALQEAAQMSPSARAELAAKDEKAAWLLSEAMPHIVRDLRETPEAIRARLDKGYQADFGNTDLLVDGDQARLSQYTCIQAAQVGIQMTLQNLIWDISEKRDSRLPSTGYKGPELNEAQRKHLNNMACGRIPALRGRRYTTADIAGAKAEVAEKLATDPNRKDTAWMRILKKDLHTKILAPLEALLELEDVARKATIQAFDRETMVLDIDKIADACAKKIDEICASKVLLNGPREAYKNGLKKMMRNVEITPELMDKIAGRTLNDDEHVAARQKQSEGPDRGMSN